MKRINTAGAVRREMMKKWVLAILILCLVSGMGCASNPLIAIAGGTVAGGVIGGEIGGSMTAIYAGAALGALVVVTYFVNVLTEAF